MYMPYKVIDNDNELGKVVIAQFTSMADAMQFVKFKTIMMIEHSHLDSNRYQIFDRGQ